MKHRVSGYVAGKNPILFIWVISPDFSSVFTTISKIFVEEWNQQ